ncbi:hypothetical protein GCM10023156_12340 [Novipirellula rosea]|uniref:Uncharacterized protein n=1 Tax=Novipirellula rosea TaxID=1031540 RepID=A0ABP8MGJ6_9BACT
MGMAIAAIAAIMNAPATARPGLSPRASVAAAQAAGMPMPNEPTIVTVMSRKVDKSGSHQSKDKISWQTANGFISFHIRMV